jgi:hypothetical protein
MKKLILKIIALSLFAAAIVATSARAQDATSTNIPAVVDQTPVVQNTNPPAVIEPVPVQNTSAPTNAPVKKHKKRDHSVFNGKLVAVDTNAMTLTVGERTFEISSETIITKDGAPAILSDGVVGEPASGAFKKDADGKLTATSIHFGGKADGEKKKKKTASDNMASSTNSVPN